MITVDARGLACPQPVINTKNAIKKLKGDEQIRVLVDNEVAVQNLLRLAMQNNFEAKGNKLAESEFEVIMNAVAGSGGDENTAGENEPAIVQPKGNSDFVVVISSDRMGEGSEELGKKLMKAFVFAVTKQEKLPKAVLLYNAGANLSCEGSDSLEDLKALEAEGVDIATCGTCLDFYGLTEKLSVGRVSNMYDIVEIMEKAGHTVRP
ncbi:MAG: sulfurtransferase-like selenium metabolism protein YedF [Clostridia bacterium]|nr:sulfurtransferase-like selenium metabolism protein YedF [Clostridia bacterium]